ncbi:MAG: radical SAM protein [Planctomycetota bacterium]
MKREPTPLPVRRAAPAVGPRFEALWARAEKHHIPLRVILELTRRCNLACRHCFQERGTGTGDIPFPRIETLLDELREAGTMFLTLTGGEPLLHPRFGDILAAASDRGFVVTVFTNATRADETTARQFGKAGVESAGISLLGASAAVHDAMTGVPGSFESTTRGIRRLAEAGVPVRLKTVLTTMNFPDRRALAALGKSLGAEAHRFTPLIHPGEAGNRRPIALRLPRPDLETAYREESGGMRPCPRPAAKGDPGFLASCSAGRALAAIRATGLVTACVNLPISAGRLEGNRFADLWRNAPGFAMLRRQTLADLPVCRSCPHRPFCKRCPGLALTEGGSLTGPAAGCCLRAEIRHAMFQESPETR